MTEPSPTVLFARRDSIYRTLGCDVWDMPRDARLYSGASPVIAHPPCRAWGRLAYFAKPRRGERGLARFSLEWVRRNGGVLEHPATSRLWQTEAFEPDGVVDVFGGFTFVIDQHWLGHKAQKRTRLYICGLTPSALPSFDLFIDEPTHVVSTSRRGKNRPHRKRLSQRACERTPEPFARWLIEITHRIRGR